jgi:hypothetical protein
VLGIYTWNVLENDDSPCWNFYCHSTH